jgi:signal transduction histidine kinase
MPLNESQLFAQEMTNKLNNNEYINPQEIKKILQIYETQNKLLSQLAQKSKMALMGEMMDSIAHQWKQPLNAMAMISSMLREDYDNGLIDKEYIDELAKTTDTQIEHMLNTLSEFRDFFRPETDIHHLFSLAHCIQSVKLLMKDELIVNNITIEEHVEPDIKIFGSENKFKHIFINLITNSCEEFTKIKKLSRYIYIRAYTKDEQTIIEFEDTAGGIPEHIIKDVFQANITTKANTKGTGIGLYLVTQILQTHNASISVKNSNLGAVFTIVIDNSYKGVK